MECNSWVEEGILYTSGELPADRYEALRKHLSSCKSCSDELETYNKEKKNWFTVDMLGQRPSPQVDQKITQACSKLPRPATFANPVSSLFKRALFSILFLAVGFGGGVYFSINLEPQNGGSLHMAEQKAADTQPDVSGKNNQSAQKVAADTKTDSLDSNGLQDEAAPLKRGNLKIDGVVPVDLKDE
ncbi:MAG: zf-HC2 domain-containing protein [Chitinivibrionales bacterium]